MKHENPDHKIPLLLGAVAMLGVLVLSTTAMLDPAFAEVELERGTPATVFEMRYGDVVFSTRVERCLNLEPIYRSAIRSDGLCAARGYLGPGASLQWRLSTDPRSDGPYFEIHADSLRSFSPSPVRLSAGATGDSSKVVKQAGGSGFADSTLEMIDRERYVRNK